MEFGSVMVVVYKENCEEQGYGLGLDVFGWIVLSVSGLFVLRRIEIGLRWFREGEKKA